MRRIRLIFCILLSFLSACLYAQDITNFTQFFINPYSINPSYAGIEGRGALFFAYRKQWTSIEGAPTIASFTYHAPTPVGINYGLNFTSDTRGILKTSSVMLTGGYTVTIDKQKFIRFGISAGAAFNSVDNMELSNTALYDPSDPVIANMMNKNTYLIGNAGVSFHLKSAHFGVSLPNIFTPAYVSTKSFEMKEVKPFQAVIIHASNRFYFAKDKNVFEPYLIYRMNQGLPGQFEAAAVLHLNHVLWFGGSFKQDFGISALGGVKVQNFLLIGGSYSIKNSGINELNSPSMEIQLSYIFGARKKEIPVYSFVNTVKEKEKKKKSPAQIAAEKNKQEVAAAKKKADEQALKKQEEERKQELARREEEAKKTAVVVAPVVITKQETKPVETKPIETKPVETKPVETKPIETKPSETKQETVVTPPVNQQQRHDGGPRLKSDVLDIELPTYDTAHHEEQARLARLEEHAADPTEHHGDDPGVHPNSERHEFVKRGSHAEEMDIGDYVIIGVFKTGANADHFSEGLKKLGFNADNGHLSEKGLWYVYIAHTDDINKAKAERDKYRKMKIFRDAWLLTVHH